MPLAAVRSAEPPRLQRARGSARVGFRRHADGATRLADLWQDGCGKVRLPRVHDGRGPVAVLLNTAGGVTGGDEIDYAADWGAGARATVTTQAAERVYRRSEGVARIRSRLTLGAGAEGFWLPQETIVFDRAGLDRTLEIELAAGARFVGCEAVVLGRTAMGEEVRETALADRWRVRRGGRLVFADQLRLQGDARDILAGGATGRGARAFATIVDVSDGAAARLDAVRAVIEARSEPLGASAEAGASTFDGMLVARILAADGRALRAMLEPLLTAIIDGPLPRVWAI